MLVHALFKNKKEDDFFNEANELLEYEPLNIDHVHDLIRINNLQWEEKCNNMTKSELKILAATIRNTFQVHIKNIHKYEKQHMYIARKAMPDIKDFIKILEYNKHLLVTFRDIFDSLTEKTAVKRILENETFDRPTKKTEYLLPNEAYNAGGILFLNAEFARKMETLDKEEIVSFIKGGIYLITISEICHLNMRISKIEDEAAKFKNMSTSTIDVDIFDKTGFPHLMNMLVDGLVLVKSIEEIYVNNNIPVSISSEMNARYVNLFETADYLYKLINHMDEGPHISLREIYMECALLPFGFIRVVIHAFAYSVLHEGVSWLPIWNFERAPKVSLNQMIALRTDLRVENLQMGKSKYYDHLISKRCNVY